MAGGGNLRIVRIIMVVWLLVGASSVSAQEKSGVKPGFKLTPGSAHIVLIRPSIQVGAQSTAGMFEPNADWTAQARDALGAALRTAERRLGNDVTDYVEPVGADAATLAEYQALFDTVAASVIEYQFFVGNRLPTKKRKDQFDWSLGPDVATLPGLAGADYALFVSTEDHFGSTGRKVLQIFAALARVPVTAGVHRGFAGMVDLRTGDLVWLNADWQMGGDVRDAAGAEKRVRQLLAGFPGKPAAAP